MAIAVGEPLVRQVGLVVLDRIGESALPTVLAHLDEGAVRPYLSVWLRAHGHEGGPPLNGVDAATFFVDAVAMALKSAGPAAVMEVVGELPGGPAALTGMVDELWRVPSPYTGAVLDAIAEHHRDKSVRKAARKSLFRLRSTRR